MVTAIVTVTTASPRHLFLGLDSRIALVLPLTKMRLPAEDDRQPPAGCSREEAKLVGAERGGGKLDLYFGIPSKFLHRMPHLHALVPPREKYNVVAR